MATTKEVFPSDAILWLEFGGQYVNGAGKTVIDNLATMGNAVKTVQCGDGTTASTFPTQLVGKRGLSFDGGDYIDTGIVDPFERTDKFSLFVAVSLQSVATIGSYLSTSDTAQSNKGIFTYPYSNNKKMYVFLTSQSTTNEIDYYINCNLQSFNTFCVTSSGSSLASGIKVYDNAIVGGSSGGTDNLTSTIKNGKPFLLGARHNGVSKTTFYTGNIYFAAIFPRELTPLQVSNLHKKVMKRINLP